MAPARGGDDLMDHETALLLGFAGAPIVVRIPGEPVTWARTGSNKEGVRFTKPKQRTAKGVLVMYFEKIMEGVAPLDGPVRVDLIAMFTCPKGDHRCIACGRKHGSAAATAKCFAKNEARDQGQGRRWHTKQKDRDNLLKLVQDAAEGIMYLNDKQACDGVTVKLIAAQGEAPATVIIFTPLQEYAGEYDHLLQETRP